jgi:NitT/TauT family transport system substrate-binding protein
MAEKPEIKIGHLRITDHLILGITKYKIQKAAETLQHSTLQTYAMDGWDYIGDALTKGHINGAFILAPYAMELFHSGEKIKLVLVGHKNGSVIIKNKRLNIQKVEDFKGKTILIPFHLSIHMMLFDKMLRDKGLETGPGKDVVFDVVAPPQIPEYMAMDEEGDIGGFIVAEPFGSQVIKEGYGEEFALSKDLWPDHPCCVFILKEEIIEKYPEAVQELVDSFVKSGMLVSQKPDVAAKIGSAFLKQDIDVIQRVLTEPIDRLKTNSLLPDLQDLDRIQTYLTEVKSAMSGRIDVEKFINLEFAKNAGAT